MAQLVARTLRVREAPGSSPGTPTLLRIKITARPDVRRGGRGYPARHASRACEALRARESGIPDQERKK